jgi:hypothetical protein
MRRITTTFATTTPESVEEGDFEETGIEDTDEFEDWDEAAEFLVDSGVTETSSSEFHPGIWYSTDWWTEDFRTGEEKQLSFHLKGFTEDEERRIYERVWEGN